jgi:hypothetical protein
VNNHRKVSIRVSIRVSIQGLSMEDLEFSDYELNQEDDIILDIETDSYLDNPRHGQAYYINNGDY